MRHWTWHARIGVMVAALGGMWARAAVAQTPLPLGPQQLANSATTGNQDEAAVALDASGNFIVVWRDEFRDGTQSDIVGRRFSSRTGLPLSAEFVINSTTSGDQRHPVIATSANGRFVVVWEGPDSPTSRGIFGSLRASNGTQIGAEFQVNTSPTGTQQYPAVAMQNDGRFLVAWQDNSTTRLAPDTSGTDIFGRLYPANFPASLPDPPFAVNIFVGGDQEKPAVASFASTGGWYVAWQGPSLPPVVPAIFLRMLDAAGGGQSEMVLNTSSGSSFRSNVALSSNSFGNAIGIWQDLSTNSIFARHILTGDPSGLEEQVNLSPDHVNREPSVALDKFENYVAIWVEALGARAASGDAPEGSPIVIQGRKHNASGGFSELLPPPTDSQFQVNSGGANFVAPRIAAEPHGNFVAVWAGTDPADPSGRSVPFRRFLDALFADDFETADTSRWSTAIP